MNTINNNPHPVLLIPGLTGTRLKTKKGSNTDYDLWLNPKHILLSNQESLNLDEASEQELLELQAFVGWDQPKHEISYQSKSLPLIPSRWWRKEMSLNRDNGITPLNNPDYNRPRQGLDAIANLAPNSIFQERTRYFEALIDRLKNNGYTDSNLKAAPYDWRTAPKGLIDRYDYFNHLQQIIEQLYTQNNSTPIVIIAHSLGNRITQYLLQTIKNNPNLGQTWIDKYIARYIAVSPPWLGAPASISHVVTDSLTLGPIVLKKMKKVIQSYSVIPWLFPVTEAEYRYFNTENFAFLNNDSNPLTIEKTLQKGGASSTEQYSTKYYLNDENFSGCSSVFGSCAVECPPVNQLDVFYGTGFDTEVGAYYSYSKEKLRIDRRAECADPNLTVKNGIRLETVKTKQTIDGTINSGDGIVPYGSLVYFKQWQSTNSQTQIDGHEFQDCKHTEILFKDEFQQKVLSLLGIRNIL